MTEITKDWCIAMARAEEADGDPEVGAGALPAETENDRLRVALNDAKRELQETCHLLHFLYHKAIKATEAARTELAAAHPAPAIEDWVEKEGAKQIGRDALGAAGLPHS